MNDKDLEQLYKDKEADSKIAALRAVFQAGVDSVTPVDEAALPKYSESEVEYDYGAAINHAQSAAIASAQSAEGSCEHALNIETIPANEL
jgi:hypothetical protein